MHNKPEMTEEVLLSWNQCHGAFYQLCESDLLWNLQEQRQIRYWNAMVGGVPVLWAEAAPEGVALGISPTAIWLSLFGSISEGSEASFSSKVEKLALEMGKTRLAIAGDEFHFLPGIPVDEPAGQRLSQAFKDQGFSTSECADFVGAPDNPHSSAYIRSSIEEARGRGWALCPVEADWEREELTRFLAKEFPGRWFREWTVWRHRNDGNRALWKLLRDEKNLPVGFSRTAIRGKFSPHSKGWTPGALRLPLASGASRADTDSCLGPIGVAASERGRGAGKILLGLSLSELSLQGAKLTCIDWTNAYNYYTPLGFHVARRYLSVWKDF